MRNINYGKIDMISGAFPTINLSIVSALLFIIWILCHVVSERTKKRHIKIILFMLQLIVSSSAIWSLLQLVGRQVLLATDWNLWENAILTGFAIEFMILFYKHEYHMVSKIKAYFMVGLRTITIGIISIILAQPILRKQHTKGIERIIAVLIDDSVSMRFSDNQLSVSEKLDVAKLYSIEGLENRPPIENIRMELEKLRNNFKETADELELPLNLDTNYIETKFNDYHEPLSQLMVKSSKEVRGIIATFTRISNDSDHYGKAIRKSAAKVSTRIKNTLLRPISLCIILLKSKTKIADSYIKLQEKVDDIAYNSSEFLNELDVLKEELDNAFFMQLNFDLRKKINAMSQKTRAEIARRILLKPIDGSNKNILSKIKETHGLTLISFTDTQKIINEKQLSEAIKNKSNKVDTKSNSETKENSKVSVSPNLGNQRTDITGALEYVKNNIPAENLAGIIILSDGCHNTGSRIEPIAKILGHQQVPVCTVRVGGIKVPKDNAIMNVIYPTTIFLGEKLTLGVELKSNGYKNREVTLELLKDNKVVRQKNVFINSDRFKSKVSFQVTPQKNGVFSYNLRIKNLENEATYENNNWDISVAVSDDRTNVLLVDNHPRWEFRYLRNLFHGRDKSVHLQHILLSPDTVAGITKKKPIFASADRKFGDDLATAFPIDKKEWAKFDVIILGDLSPNELTDDVIEKIRFCVEERGALLVCIAGQHYMPHAFSSQKLKELLPIKFSTGSIQQFKPYKIALTPFGQHHMIMKQAKSFSENIHIWEQFPLIYWRFPITGIKNGANIVAYASDIAEKDNEHTVDVQTPQALRDQIEKGALIVVQRKGHGRVAMLNFDRVWRFRYGFGDKYHHQFWKQLINWGIGDKLRSGNNYVRLGTPALTYTNNDKVTILVKIQDKDFKPVNNKRFHLTISYNGKKIRKRLLRYKDDSAGLYEVTFDHFSNAGKYVAGLTGDEIDKLGVKKKGEKLETEFLIVSSKAPVEVSELAARDDILQRISTITKGEKCNMLCIGHFINKFGEGNRFITINEDTPLWDSFKLLLLLLTLISAEWVIRKFGGLI